MSDLFDQPRESRELFFVVPGEVRGKGRPRFRVVKPKSGGEFVTTYTDAETKKYEAKVGTAAAVAKGRARWQMVPTPDPKTEMNPIVLRLDVEAWFLIPVSRSKKMREALDGKLAINRIDADNVIKACLDGMQNIIFADDKSVAVMTCTKRWTKDEAQECLKVKVSTCG